MSISWLITNLLAAVLLPPTNLLLVGIAGILMLKQRRRLGHILIVASLIGTGLLSTPYVAKHFLAYFEVPPLIDPNGQKADAIVILGGGTYRNAPEYGIDTIKPEPLERLRYGAWLARRTGKPILVSGGAPDGGPAEAPLMQAVLEQDFRVKVRWIEDTSNNTHENAADSAELLKQAGIRRIYLVSQAWHLMRAIPEFERAGLTVIPAGTGYINTAPLLPLDFIPDGKYLRYSYYASHEAIGLAWYKLRRLFDYAEDGR